jgi:hypothetical protein
MTELVQAVVERLSQLPEPVQHRLAQRFLKEVEAAEAQTGTPRSARIAGLGKETITIADDFDEPLPDAFWLGEE